jgi:hypothetical protein
MGLGAVGIFLNDALCRLYCRLGFPFLYKPSQRADPLWNKRRFDDKESKEASSDYEDDNDH